MGARDKFGAGGGGGCCRHLLTRYSATMVVLQLNVGCWFGDAMVVIQKTSVEPPISDATRQTSVYSEEQKEKNGLFKRAFRDLFNMYIGLRASG